MGKWPVMTTEKRFRPARVVAPHVVCGFRARTFALREPQCIEVQLRFTSTELGSSIIVALLRPRASHGARSPDRACKSARD